MPSRKIEELHPIVQGMCKTWLELCKQANLPILIICTLRTAEEQLAYYVQGRKPLQIVNMFRKNAGLPPITHEENRIVTNRVISTHEYGLAIDFCIANGENFYWEIKADVNQNNISDYREAGEIAEKVGFTWGGRFGIEPRDYTKKIGWDPGHIEYTGGLTIADLRAGKRPHGADV